MPFKMWRQVGLINLQQTPLWTMCRPITLWNTPYSILFVAAQISQSEATGNGMIGLIPVVWRSPFLPSDGNHRLLPRAWRRQDRETNLSTPYPFVYNEYGMYIILATTLGRTEENTAHNEPIDVAQMIHVIPRDTFHHCLNNNKILRHTGSKPG
jgi:hypothetical protein